MQKNLTFAAVVAVVALFLLNSAIIIVPETKSAVVFRFGAPNSVYSTAGIKFKVPLMDTHIFFDKRNRGLDQPVVEIIAKNQERLLVDAFARYRIIDPQVFYQSVRNEDTGEGRLGSLMNRTVRRVLGEATVDQIVSTDRANLMRRIRDLLAEDARGLGIEIIDVKIRRAELPQQNSEAVFQRMITERKQIAERIRAEGTAQAQEIRAQGDRKATEEIAK
ncbi:MAG: protease modulator HflC, partial [Parvularculaceae bacterium]|nr:protease modulator HflC [Parvularculaceae bacterium]